MSSPVPPVPTLCLPRWWPLCLVALLLLAGCAALRLGALDAPLFLMLNAAGRIAPAFWAGLSVAGLGLSAFILLAAASPGRDERRLAVVASLLWCFPIGGLLTHGLKRLFSTPRPQAVLPLDQMQVIGEPLLHNSLPSGHAITTLAMAWLWLHTRSLGRGEQALVWIAALLVVGSRITTAAHWPSDVLAGAAVGLVAAQLSLQANRRWSAAAWLARPVGQRVLGAGQIATGVAMFTTHTGYPLAEPLQWVLGTLGVAAGLWRLVSLRSAATASAPGPAR